MSILICSTAYGGCGYVGKGEQFGGNGDYVICPGCSGDHCLQLTDENFDSLTNDRSREEARELLDEEHATIHGGFLEFCVKENFISESRLTAEQKKNLDYEGLDVFINKATWFAQRFLFYSKIEFFIFYQRLAVF